MIEQREDGTIGIIHSKPGAKLILRIKRGGKGSTGNSGPSGKWAGRRGEYNRLMGILGRNVAEMLKKAKRKAAA